MTSTCGDQKCEKLKEAEVSEDDLKKLISYFSEHTYQAKSETAEAKEALRRCIQLCELDYSLIFVNNANGDLCTQYPSQVIIPENEKPRLHKVSAGNGTQPTHRTTSTIYENIYDIPKLKDLFIRAKFARVRGRFPAPVILYNGKYVCRSATLSGGPEIYGRSTANYVQTAISESTKPTTEEEISKSSDDESFTITDWQLFDKVRGQDIKLLKNLHVGTIVDLMVENKKVKYYMKVTSSEKIDKEHRYSDFNIMSLPYPGCEFFKTFHDNHHDAEKLVFHWNPWECDATLSIPHNPMLQQLKIDWENYKKWDLVEITQNYVKYILKYLQDNSSGMLIHCISGWDRTPLFISLVRLSLWADGLAHKNLNEYQILYLIIAYDWMLFGHHLHDRLAKAEDIFLFCFYMLKYLTSEDYSIALGRHKFKKHQEKPAEEVVNRADSDSPFEVIFERDSESHGPNSSVSNRSLDPALLMCHSHDESNGNAARPSSNMLDVDRSSPMSVEFNGNSPSRCIGAKDARSSPQAHRLLSNESNGNASSNSPTQFLNSPSQRHGASNEFNGNPSESSTHVFGIRETSSPLQLPRVRTESSNSSHSVSSTGSWQILSSSDNSRGSDSNTSDVPMNNAVINNIMDAEDGSQHSIDVPDMGSPQRRRILPANVLEANGNPPSSPSYSLDVHNSPQRRRTSPVTVPLPTRVRTISQHSSGSGSWQVVTGTGSIRSSDSQCSLSQLNPDTPFASTSMGTIVGEEEEEGEDPPCREERLLKVRELFYKCYFPSAGYKNMRYGPHPTIPALLGYVAEKVGLATKN